MSLTQPTRDEKNRVLAEWLGWQPFQLPWHWLNPEGKCEKLPDFYTSEEASALLLEKMPLPSLFKDGGGWNCTASFGDNAWTFNHADRKTAIAEAAYQFCTRSDA